MPLEEFDAENMSGRYGEKVMKRAAQKDGFISSLSDRELQQRLFAEFGPEENGRHS